MRIAVVKRIGTQLLLGAALLMVVRPAHAIPAFARKYGLPCSACHEAWPMLNNFGQTFKDNGYQLGNDRDAPIYQQPAYWPIMFRVSTNLASGEQQSRAGGQGPGQRQERLGGVHGHGVGVRCWRRRHRDSGHAVQETSRSLCSRLSGTQVLVWHKRWVRLDNLFKSSWLNVKMGKFELDEPISQERTLTLSNTGALYYNYFFTPPGDNNFFTGIGNFQLGAEVSGHSENDYTRYSVAVVSNNNGATGLQASQSYNLYTNFNQAFEVSGLGLQRVGVYSYFGQSPTFYQTSGGNPIPGTGMGNRGFYRVGAYGQWYVGQVRFSNILRARARQRFPGQCSAGESTSTSCRQEQWARSWNGGFVEAHYTTILDLS